MNSPEATLALPLFGITFGVAGITVFICSFWADDGKALRALGGILLVCGALNGYVEGWNYLRNLPFGYFSFVLVSFFAWAYSRFSIRLFTCPVPFPRKTRFVYSFLPFVWLLCLGLVTASPSLTDLESPPMALLIGLGLVCWLHVPTFAYGKSVARSSLPPREALREAFEHPVGGITKRNFTLIVFLVLSPGLAAFSLQIAIGNDWRLLGADAALITALLALAAMSGNEARSFLH